MKIDTATPEDVTYVATRMRDSDFRELSAVLPTETRYQLIELLTMKYGLSGQAIVARAGGEPVAVGGVALARPNVATLYFFATDKFPSVGKSLTKWVKKELFPRLREAGVHRFECISSEDHVQAHKWIRALGLRPEGPAFRGYGKNRENFVQFAWVEDDE